MHLCNPVRVNLFSASETGPARSRVQSANLLKTLFLLEHLPELVTCTNSHVLGLVLNVFEVTRLLMRLAADNLALQTRYPIYFVVKHPNRLVCFS